ncbi:MAG TPA: ECF-type sigma factor, partial [Phycisphaerae bacterium]|nr:ECF-type sigma factor [Phycisphaerae bacterium]
RLAERDARAASIVQLRFFAGLSVEDTAAALGLSERTIKREWAFARAWLYQAING